MLPVDDNTGLDLQSPEAQAYDAAHDKFLAAGKAFRAVQLAYRERRIGDAEFLAARAKFIEAGKEFDIAEAALK